MILNTSDALELQLNFLACRCVQVAGCAQHCSPPPNILSVHHLAQQHDHMVLQVTVYPAAHK
jgi:hypothetical protein